MEIILVEKAKLLEILQTNRENHRKVFEEALEGYRVVVIRELTARLEDAKASRNRADWITIPLVQPVDQTKDYDRAIGMLEMHTEGAVELSQQEYMNYVEDEWRWSRGWSVSNTNYVSTPGNKALLNKYSESD